MRRRKRRRRKIKNKVLKAGCQLIIELDLCRFFIFTRHDQGSHMEAIRSIMLAFFLSLTSKLCADMLGAHLAFLKSS